MYYNITAFELLTYVNTNVANIFGLQVVVKVLHYTFQRLYIKRLNAVFIIKLNTNFIYFIIKNSVRGSDS